MSVSNRSVAARQLVCSEAALGRCVALACAAGTAPRHRAATKSCSSLSDTAPSSSTACGTPPRRPSRHAVLGWCAVESSHRHGALISRFKLYQTGSANTNPTEEHSSPGCQGEGRIADDPSEPAACSRRIRWSTPSKTKRESKRRRMMGLPAWCPAAGSTALPRCPPD